MSAKRPRRRRAVPVMDRGQALAGERRVRRRLVPAHASDRKVRLTVGIRSGLPRRGPRPSGGVAESLDRLFPRHGPAAFDEWLPPIVAPAVPALIDELLELPVGDLESIDPEVVELADQAEPNGIAACRPRAPCPAAPRPPDPAGSAASRRGSGALDRLKPCLGDPHSEETAWNADAVERRPAKGEPARRGRSVGGECHVGARRVGGHDAPGWTRRATAASAADRRARRPAPDGREGTPRHSHHDSRAAGPRARRRFAPSGRGS